MNAVQTSAALQFSAVMACKPSELFYLCFQIGKLQTELANCQAELEMAKRGGSVQELLEKKQESLSIAIHEIDALKIQVDVAVLEK